MAINQVNILKLDESWESIQKGISKLKRILEWGHESFASEEYISLYTMCSQKPPYDYSQQLYVKYKEACDDCINSVLPSLREKHDEIMLKELVKRFTNHKIMVRWLSRLFHYLDRYMIAHGSLCLRDVGLICFRDLVYQELRIKARDAVIALVEECLKKEKERVSHYLHSSSETKLLERVQKELLVEYTNQLLEKEHSGCRTLLRDDKFNDLSRMYRLFLEIPEGLDVIANMFEQHVKAEGMVLVQQAEVAAHSNDFVPQVIELHGVYMLYVTDCFSNNFLFQKALKEAFEVFCNKVIGGCSSAVVLASYCNNILSKGRSKGLSDDDIDEKLENAAMLLAYIGDKDHFAALYRKDLSFRLLFDKSANEEHERYMLTLLKLQIDVEFILKMEWMIKDFRCDAKENQYRFQEYLNNNPAASPGIDLTVSLLSTRFLPSYKSSDLSLPAEMAKCVEVFEEFHQPKTKRKKLKWIYSLGTCTVNGKFDAKTIKLVLGTYQAAVLLLFNTSDILSYQDIKSQLNLADEDLIRSLHSLACDKYKILIKQPNTQTVSSNDRFEFNSKFTHKKRKIRIHLPPGDERKVVEEEVFKDRSYAIDACIVRIMKSRKVMSSKELVVECVEQLRRKFKPDSVAIKKRIDTLVDRCYLERDKADRNIMRYLI